MLSSVLFGNMEDGSNFNGSSSNFSSFDENIINSVRNRKKVTDLTNCPTCSCTIRQGELRSHLSLELDRLQKLSSGGNKRKLSANSSTLAAAGASTSSADNIEDTDIDMTGCTGSDVYQRVHGNRVRRLRSRRRGSPPPAPATGECPVCGATLPTQRLQRHALRCLKRTGASVDDAPSSSEEDQSIDVENDEDYNGGSFGAEYQWCGEWRIRATALQPPTPTISSRRASHEQKLVVDGDEDEELYGPPQYSPSRIAPDAEILPSEESATESTETAQTTADAAGASYEVPARSPKANGLVEASAETRIQALKLKIRELEKRQNSEAKCLICLGHYVSPAVSIQCWHVYCEVCWLESLKAKKICPQCNAITTSQHLRRIYM